MRDWDKWFLISEKTTLENAEIYGDFLTYPTSHFEIWESLTRMSSSQLKLARLPATIFGKEYEEVPRGRVVYSKPDGLFTMYADRRLQQPEIIQALCRAFCLENETYVVRSDGHYR